MTKNSIEGAEPFSVVYFLFYILPPWTVRWSLFSYKIGLFYITMFSMSKATCILFAHVWGLSHFHLYIVGFAQVWGRPTTGNSVLRAWSSLSNIHLMQMNMNISIFEIFRTEIKMNICVEWFFGSLKCYLPNGIQRAPVIICKYKSSVCSGLNTMMVGDKWKEVCMWKGYTTGLNHPGAFLEAHMAPEGLWKGPRVVSIT